MIDRRLELLRVVAEYGTITAAAQALYRSPSGISQQLRELAKELDVVLLEPDGRRVRLTPAARVLVARTDALHGTWEQVKAEIQQQAAEPSGVVRVAAFPTALSALVVPAMRRLATDHPDVVMQAIEAEPPESFYLLLTEEADLAIAVAGNDTPTRDNPKYTQRPVFKEPIDLIVPPGHHLAERRTVDLAETAAEPWIFPSQTQFGRQECTALCYAAGFTPIVAHYAHDWSTIASLVADGHGIAFLTRLACLPAQFDVARIQLAGTPTPTRQLLGCVRTGAETQPRIALALATLKEVATQ